MSPAESSVFELLDEHAKKHYANFVAEMTWIQGRGVYSVCFRPTAEYEGDEDPDLCQYVDIEVNDVEASHKRAKLTDAIVAKLYETFS